MGNAVGRGVDVDGVGGGLWGLTASFYPASSLSNWQQVSQETLTANSRRFLAPPSEPPPLLKPPLQTPVCLCHAYAAHTACNEFALTSRKESSGKIQKESSDKIQKESSDKIQTESSGKIQCASLAYNTHSVTISEKHQSMFTFSLSDDLFLSS